MRFRSTAGSILFMVLVFTLGSFLSLSAQDRIPEGPLKEQFFEELTRPQIVSLLKTLEKSGQRTDLELGARYRWGAIPPDRRPPARLAQWWRSLSQQKRNEQRVKWFREHYDEINVDRAARELGETERLMKIQRDLQKNYGDDSTDLESVFFPGDTAQTPQSADEDEQEYQDSYRQSTEGPDQPGEMVPVSESESSRSDKSSRSGHSDRGRDEGKLDETTTSDSTPKSSSAQASDADPSSESETSSGTDVRYRRVGDEIRLIDGSPSTLSSNGADTLVSDTNGTSDPSDDSSRTERTESANPNQNLNDTGGASPSLFLPQPDLPSADTGPTLRTPED